MTAQIFSVIAVNFGQTVIDILCFI
ncbi:hypothetical protein DSUL_20431 [Desulfovibrionales bacterium]